MNYYIGGDSVFGYHVVNFAIHYLAALFLFLLIYDTLQLPSLNDRYGTTAYSIALLSVFFWATHPIQVTAVTYIVQRMASMTGMFYIMAMYLYLKGRTALGTEKKVVFLALGGLAAILSFASKENAAMLPISIFLYDVLLIQESTPESFKTNRNILLLLVALLVLIAFFCLNPLSILDGYEHRPFTLSERLLTQPRVILFYLSLIVYPINSRLTLLHDIEISKSLFIPWTTLPAILTILFLMTVAIMISRKKPLVAYCILFFFINHLIEGSIIPLELIFEHRNYLPSAFFFVLIALLLLNILDYFSYNNSFRRAMVLTIILLLAAQGHTTHLRNSIFKNDLTLWSDNVKKAANLHRPHHNLGKAYLVAGLLEEGIAEMNRALKSKAGARSSQKYRTYYNLATFYLHQKEYDKALGLLLKYIQQVPNQPPAYAAIATIMLHKNNLKLAEKYIHKAIRLDPDASEFRRTLESIRSMKETRQLNHDQQK
jgi:tetratricopeptide (TPR) repeat protein